MQGGRESPRERAAGRGPGAIAGDEALVVADLTGCGAQDAAISEFAFTEFCRLRSDANL